MKPTTRKLSRTQRLVFDFFRAFARAEYALKAAGLLKLSDKPLANAEPNWDAFVARIENQWAGAVAPPTIAAARDYLLEHPPMKQVVRDGALGWADLDRNNESESRFMLRCVKTIRNNLFHGGKRHKISPERDKPLIESALAILNVVMVLDADVQRHFEGEV